MMKINVVNRIREVLDERGIKARWLAEQAGITGTTLTNYLKNRRQPDAEVLARIAKVLDLTVDDLLRY